MPQKKLAIEYDGVKHHGEDEKMLKDASRRDALVAMGVTVNTVTKRQINDGGALNGIAHSAARHLGKQLRYKDPQFTKKHLELRGKLGIYE